MPGSYKLAPSLIAFGRTVQEAGFPLTARCDLVWPEHPEANDPSQYLHLNATLIAPLEGDHLRGVGGSLPTSRSVWIPPYVPFTVSCGALFGLKPYLAF